MNFFKKLSLKNKVLFSSGILSLLITINAVFIYQNVNSMVDAQKWVTHTVSVIQKLKGLIELMIDMETGQRGYLMSGDKKFLEPYNNAIGKFDPALRSLQKTVSDNPVQVKRLEKILGLKEEWLKVAQNVEMKIRSDLDNGVITKEEFEKVLKTAQGKTLMDAIRKEVSDSIEMEEKLNVIRKAHNIEVADHTINWVTYGLIISLIIGFSLLYGVVNQIMKQVSNISGELTSSSKEVLSASEKAAKTSHTLESSSAQQASSLQETSSSISEISSMISRNSDNAKNARENSLMSKESAIKGKNIVEKMIGSIDKISESNKEISSRVEESNNEMQKIISVISEIADKTKVINDIVFQTKLLSFNASVEAARAGEHGKGFAVVAEEVGSLAQMSGKAAGEIFEMLETSVKNVESIIESTKSRVETLINDGGKKVEEGILIANECGTVLEEIVNNVNQVSELTNEISTASEEQARGVSEVSAAISQLSDITTQNSTLSSESSMVSNGLATEAELLSSLTSQLRYAVEGEGEFEQTNLPQNKNNVVFMKKNLEKPSSNSEFKMVSGSDVANHYENNSDFEDL